MPSILIVEDEMEILQATQWAFETFGFVTFTATDGPEALESLQRNHPEAILIDHKLRTTSGLKLIQAIRALDPKVLIFAITGLVEELEKIEAEYRKLGATAVFYKPLKMSAVVETILKALAS
jgi:DNA-binding response OmpR family regulator